MRFQTPLHNVISCTVGEYGLYNDKQKTCDVYIAIKELDLFAFLYSSVQLISLA